MGCPTWRISKLCYANILKSHLSKTYGAFWLKVVCLNAHIPTLDEVFQKVTDEMKTPASEIDPVQVGEFIDEQKAVLKTVDVDVKDAKRRITAAKGPRPKAAVNTADDGASDETD